MKKLLVFGVIVLFLGLAIAPSINAKIGELSEGIAKEKDTQGFFGNGIIIFHTLHWDHAYRHFVPDGGIRLNCEDLDTGEITHIITNFFGFRFKFFPRGHDIKISVQSYNTTDKIIEDLGFIKHVKFNDREWKEYE